MSDHIWNLIGGAIGGFAAMLTMQLLARAFKK